jgi:hypothetical protein
MYGADFRALVEKEQLSRGIAWHARFMIFIERSSKISAEF